ncbi:zinc ribbon domain-containing protein [Methanobrevibacter acididurans]|uniref:zinc ribbon domain-containing protein n=1 Tax=Methanobrevibacter acididurans TaxID=120963 RepID=UPI0038FC7DD4
MKCPHCGAENKEGASICTECGKPIYEIQTKIKESKEERLLTKKIIRTAVIVIVVLLILVSGVYLFVTNNDDTNNINLGSCTMEIPSDINLTQVNASNNSYLQTYTDTNKNVMVSCLNASNPEASSNIKEVTTNLGSYTKLTNKTLNTNCTIYAVSSKLGYNYMGTYHSNNAFILIGGNDLNDISDMLNSIKS